MGRFESMALIGHGKRDEAFSVFRRGRGSLFFVSGYSERHLDVLVGPRAVKQHGYGVDGVIPEKRAHSLQAAYEAIVTPNAFPRKLHYSVVGFKVE